MLNYYTTKNSVLPLFIRNSVFQHVRIRAGCMKSDYFIPLIGTSSSSIHYKTICLIFLYKVNTNFQHSSGHNGGKSKDLHKYQYLLLLNTVTYLHRIFTFKYN